MADGAGDGGLEGLADGLGDSAEAEVVGGGGDDVLSVVDFAFAHDVAENVTKFVTFVVVDRAGEGSYFGAIGFDDLSPDCCSHVSFQSLLDF